MPRSHESIEAALNEHYTVLENITSSEDLRGYAAQAGYQEDELTEIRNLWQTAKDLTSQQHLESLEAEEATTTLRRFFGRLWDTVVELVEAGRLLYANDPANPHDRTKDATTRDDTGVFYRDAAVIPGLVRSGCDAEMVVSISGRSIR